MMKRYSFKESRFFKSQMQGFSFQAPDRLILAKDTQHHIIVFPALDSGSNDTEWGRLSFQIQNLKDGTYTVYAAASDDKADVPMGSEINIKEKAEWIGQNGIEITGHKDILLYHLKGRYLWCCIEVFGEDGTLSNLFVELPGDNFMQTFPEIYQEEGSFFHRYLSIFSTMYNEYQRKIDSAWEYLDLQTAGPELLVIYAKWLGLSIESEILEEKILRKLVQNLYSLYKIKGTKKALKNLVKIILDEECIIVERNLLETSLTREEEEIINRLYGNEMQDITLMINRKAEEKIQARLQYFLKQFLPIRCRLNLVFYGECSSMDSYCYLDRNARIHTTPKGSLDKQRLLDESVLIC